MSNSVEVTNSTCPSTGRSASKKKLVSGGAPKKSGTIAHATAIDMPTPRRRPASVGRGRAELVPAAGDVAHDQRHAGDETARESAAGKVVAGEQQVQRDDDDRVEEDPHDHLEEDRAVLGPHPLTADEPRRAPDAGRLVARA